MKQVPLERISVAEIAKLWKCTKDDVHNTLRLGIIIHYKTHEKALIIHKATLQWDHKPTKQDIVDYWRGRAEAAAGEPVVNLKEMIEALGLFGRREKAIVCYDIPSVVVRGGEPWYKQSKILKEAAKRPHLPKQLQRAEAYFKVINNRMARKDHPFKKASA